MNIIIIIVFFALITYIASVITSYNMYKELLSSIDKMFNSLLKLTEAISFELVETTLKTNFIFYKCLNKKQRESFESYRKKIEEGMINDMINNNSDNKTINEIINNIKKENE